MLRYWTDQIVKFTIKIIFLGIIGFIFRSICDWLSVLTRSLRSRLSSFSRFWDKLKHRLLCIPADCKGNSSFTLLFYVRKEIFIVINYNRFKTCQSSFRLGRYVNIICLKDSYNTFYATRLCIKVQPVEHSETQDQKIGLLSKIVSGDGSKVVVDEIMFLR